MKCFLFLLPAGFAVAAGFLFIAGDENAEAKNPPQALAAVVPDDQADGKTPLQSFMREKLESSNQILEGLVTDEMLRVQKAADSLLTMSHAEQWRASTDVLYLQHSKTYRQSVEALKAKARKHSPDGVALAWMNVTMNCIQCHEWVRNVMIADARTIAPLPAAGD